MLVVAVVELIASLAHLPLVQAAAGQQAQLQAVQLSQAPPIQAAAAAAARDITVTAARAVQVLRLLDIHRNMITQ
jgi:hypothetical protein